MGRAGLFAKHARALQGRADHERGQRHELMVLTAMRRPSRPWWVLDVRPSTEREDRSGIDLVVETPTRTLFLQVKSSRKEAQKFRQRHRDDPRPIGIVRVDDGDDLNTVYGRALGALILLRERLDLQ